MLSACSMTLQLLPLSIWSSRWTPSLSILDESSIRSSLAGIPRLNLTSQQISHRIISLSTRTVSCISLSITLSALLLLELSPTIFSSNPGHSLISTAATWTLTQLTLFSISFLLSLSRNLLSSLLVYRSAVNLLLSPADPSQALIFIMPHQAMLSSYLSSLSYASDQIRLFQSHLGIIFSLLLCHSLIFMLTFLMIYLLGSHFSKVPTFMKLISKFNLSIL